MNRLLLFVIVMGLASCSGSQEPVQPVVQATPPPPESEPAEELEHTFYQVYWEDIHALTIYRGAGPLRTEDADDPASRLTGSCDYMSVISHYVERESSLLPMIRAAEGVDEFLSALEEAGYEIEEQVLEEGY